MGLIIPQKAMSKLDKLYQRYAELVSQTPWSAPDSERQKHERKETRAYTAFRNECIRLGLDHFKEAEQRRGF